MLAGRMKRKHFLLLAGLAAVLVVGGLLATGVVGGLFLASTEAESLKPTAQPDPVAQPAVNPALTPQAPSPGATPVNPDQPSAISGPSERDVDKAVMRWAGKDLGSKKLKDVTKGRPYKVNVYQDSGNSTMNRAKVDLNRNDKWDEKWTFDGSSISRKVAPADDENYSENYVWNGSAWAKE